MLQSTKTKSIMGIIVVALTILGFFGIKIFDITISDLLWSIINVGKESETQTAESQLSFSDVGNETETGIKQMCITALTLYLLQPQFRPSGHQPLDTWVITLEESV